MAYDTYKLMHLPSSFTELIEQANTQQLYVNLIKQLNKDLALANIDLEFDIDILPSSLKLILQETIYYLIQERFMNYLNLLYIIDVSEEKVKQLESTDTVELSEQVSFYILLREWQKVWYKANFS